MFRQLRRTSDGSVAIETAIFTPIFLALMLGITDIGGGIFVRMQVNAAAQAGATYAVLNSSTPVCTSLTATCLDGIEQAMNDASGNSSFCTSAVCMASMSVDPCTAGSVCIITVSANLPYTPILPDAVYSWAASQNYSSTIKVRVH
jgi:Flp pilus assembly protein TadG